MNLMIRPLGRSRNHALLGDRVVAEGRTPILSASRALLQDGVSPDMILTVFHEGSSVVSMRVPVGVAARLTVIEKDDRSPRIAPYSPHPSQNALCTVAGRSQTAIVGRDEDFPSQTETPFSDDHVLV